MTDGSDHVELWCPSCFGPVGVLYACPACGMAGQQRPEAARLREVVARVSEVTHKRLELDRELNDLADERHRLFLTLRGDDQEAASPVAATAPRAEWRPERVRDVLLWLGATLLTIAAITFAAVAWTRLGPAGRAGILLAITGAAAALTAFVRLRLRPTAEALATLTIALALTTWGVARHTELRGDLPDMAWWAIGLAVVGTICLALARRADLTAVRLGATTLYPFAAVFALGAWKPERALTVVALALITSAVVAGRARARGSWSVVRPWLSVLGVVGTVAVVMGAVVAAVDTWGEPERIGAAIAVLAVALPPAVRILTARSDEDADLALPTAVIVLAVVGAAVTLASGSLRDAWILAGLAGAAVLVYAVGSALPGEARAGTRAAAFVVMVPALVGTVVPVIQAWLAPAQRLSEPWQGSLNDPVSRRVASLPRVVVDDVGPALFVLLALALLLAVGGLGRSRPTRVLGVGVSLAVALAVAVAGADPTIGVALGLQLATAVGVTILAIVVDRRDPATAHSLVAVALVAALPAVGWALVTPMASLVGLAAVVATGAFGAVSFRSPDLRVAAAVGAATATVAGIGVVLDQRGVGIGVIGVVVVTTAAIVVLGARLARWTSAAQPIGIALEAAGCVGMTVGVALAGDRPTWRLLGFAVGAVALLGSAIRDDERAPGYAWAALVVAGIAGLAGLADGRVPSEWITIPAAAALLGIALLGSFPIRRSWLRFGPALLMTFVTSVGIAIDRGGGLRVVLLVVAAVGVVGLGARARLGAPVVVGAAALLVLAVDGAAPYVADIPRWVLIGTAGALALWAGATADRRLQQLRRWRESLDQFT